MCELYELPRSSYYKHKNRIKPKKEKQDEIVCQLIIEYHETYDQTLGYRRMRRFINRLNSTKYSVNYIRRVMRSLELVLELEEKNKS